MGASLEKKKAPTFAIETGNLWNVLNVEGRENEGSQEDQSIQVGKGDKEKVSKVVKESVETMGRINTYVVKKPHSRRSLRIDFRCTFGNGETKVLSALIDSGAEVSLVKRSLVPSECLVPSSSSLVLLAANGSQVEGGTLEVEMQMRVFAEEPATGEKVEVEMPVVAYAAEIEYDLLLAYDWLVRSDLLMYARLNSLLIPGEPVKRIWGKNRKRTRNREILMMRPGDRRALSQMCHVMTLRGVIKPMKPRTERVAKAESEASKGGR